MKKVTLLLIGFFCSLTMFAEEITQEQAMEKACQVLKGKQLKMQPMLHRTASTDNAYYVFNAEQDGGFVVIAGNDLMPEVLGYADHGHFDLAGAPDNVKWLFDYYAKVARSLKNMPARQVVSRRASSSRAELIPLMNTQWDQAGIYQNQCPEIAGQKTLTGCVATAMAQVINFFQWPLNNVREAVGYTSDKDNKKIELPSLPARQFNWFNMTNDDIAWLMRYCGQAVTMNYGVGESTAFSTAIPGALISVFNFSKGVDEVSREEFTDEEWEEVIYQEIALGRPVIYNGSKGETGHSFVLHGYKDGQFYVNWGWGGRMDGYFALTNLKPGDNDFSEKQTAVVGIQPASNNDISYEEKSEIGFYEVHLDKQGQLASLLPEDIRYRISRLKVTGEVGGKDIDVIRSMSCYGNDWSFERRLHKLDLSEARIVGGDKYMDGGYPMVDDVLEAFIFFNCIALNNIVLPKTLKAIRNSAFSSTQLTEIFLPKSVKEIDGGAFEIKTLNTIEVEEGNPVYYSQNNAIYEKSTGKLIRGCKASGIPEGVVEIGEGAFSDAGLESIVLPRSVKKIGYYAFAYNTEVKDLYLPASVAEIGDHAFFGCKLFSISVDKDNTVFDSRGNSNAIIETKTNKLVQASLATTIPESVTAIGTDAFARVDISALDIPQTVTKMDQCGISEINALTIKVHYPTPPVLGENCFGWIPNNLRLVVPNGTKQLYAKAEQWNMFTQEGRIILEETEYINNRMMTFTVENAGELETLITSEIASAMEEVKIKGKINGKDIERLRLLSQNDGMLRSIDLDEATIVDGEGSIANELPENAFHATLVLEHIILPKNLTAIGRYAFESSGIKELVLPKTVITLGDDIFYYARNLESLSVEAGNTMFDSRDNCNAIIETATNTLRIGCINTVIPETVTAIGVKAFSGKPGLKEVSLPNSVTSLGWAAFWADTDLTKVRLSAGITDLAVSPFGGCDRITSFEVDPKNPKYDSRDNCNAIIETATNKLIQGFATTKIPDGVKIIAAASFRSMSTLTEVEIPASVKKIEPEAFLYCNNLTKVVSHIHKPFAVSSMVFSGDNMKTARLYVPYGTREAYANTPGWNNFRRIIEMEPVEGEYSKNGLSVGSVDFGKAFAALGGKAKAPVTITGEGLEPVTSIDYTITTGSDVVDYHLDLDTPVTFMMTSEVLITLDADAAVGEREKIFKLTKVNGVANECTTENIQAVGKLFTVARMPKVCPVVEEATGTWCGWCSRGIPSLALINKVYKDDVITIAVHGGGSGDPMILDNYLLNTNSYPSCSVNRNTFVDPYFGSSGKAFGIQREIEAVRREYVPAGIEVEAEWASEVQQTINVKTTTTFVEDMANANYGIGYVLVANGLKGDTPEWYQSNYYSGSSLKDEVLEPLTESNSKMTDVTFNHVPVAAFEPFEGIEGSVPATITKDVALTHNYQIDITGNTRIQDKEKLSVVALLIDKTNGKIVNAAQFKFYKNDESGETAISDAVRQNNPSQMMDDHWYTLDGRRFDAQPTKKGMYIHNGKKQVIK